jgi:hypothetical protein
VTACRVARARTHAHPYKQNCNATRQRSHFSTCCATRARFCELYLHSVTRSTQNFIAVGSAVTDKHIAAAAQARGVRWSSNDLHTPEGYVLAVSPSSSSVFVVGADAAGAFYGAVTLGAIVNKTSSLTRIDSTAVQANQPDTNQPDTSRPVSDMNRRDGNESDANSRANANRFGASKLQVRVGATEKQRNVDTDVGVGAGVRLSPRLATVRLPAYRIVDFPDLPLRGYEVESSFTESDIPW